MPSYLQEDPGYDAKVGALVDEAVVATEDGGYFGLGRKPRQDFTLPNGTKVTANYKPYSLGVGGHLEVKNVDEDVASFGFNKSSRYPWLWLDGKGVPSPAYQGVGIARMGLHVIEKIVSRMPDSIGRDLRRSVVNESVMPRGLPFRDMVRRPVVDYLWFKFLVDHGYGPADDVSARVFEKVQGLYASGGRYNEGLIRGADDCQNRGPIIFSMDPKEQLKLVLKKIL